MGVPSTPKFMSSTINLMGIIKLVLCKLKRMFVMFLKLILPVIIGISSQIVAKIFLIILFSPVILVRVHVKMGSVLIANLRLMIIG